MDPIEVLSAETPVAAPVQPRYLDLIRSCKKGIVDRVAESFQDFFGQLDEFMLSLAENAETNAVRSHCFEVMHEMLLQQHRIQQVFVAEIERGFDNFIGGRPMRLREQLDQPGSRLSLIDKADYEVSLAYSETIRRANERFAESLMTLAHRLAVLTGGSRIGEFDPALPASPAQMCDAVWKAFEGLPPTIDHKIRIQLAGEFERRVIQEAEKTYLDFNQLLVKAGILPDLSLEAIAQQQRPPSPIGGPQGVPALPPAEPPAEPGADTLDPTEFSTGSTAAIPPPGYDQGYSAADSAVEQEIFRSIQDILARRRQVSPPAGASTGQHLGSPPVTNMPHLMSSLNSLQFNTPPVSQMQFGQVSLDAVKENFAAQLGKLANLVETEQVATADADIIDLVGMLFEFILNDTSLPDSVKALLSHLHTPILKVALIDRKFFFRSKHPARRLLNGLAQAGSMCNDADGQGVFAEMKSAVDRVVQEFEDDTALFETVLEEFQSFMDGYGRKSRTLEKRVVESAKGRERLREARQSVSQELVDRTWNRAVPPAAESLLMGPWANLMVLVYLRSGKGSDEWENALKVADQILWSVEPKPTVADQARLREQLPALQESIRHGLTMVGDPEVNTNALLQDLDAVHRGLLAAAPKPETATSAPVVPTAPPPARPAPPEVQAEKALWEDIGVAESHELGAGMDVPPELVAAITTLKSVKLGTWFEFAQIGKKTKLRGKLSWYSNKTGFYIFVDQGGLQVAVKSLKVLSRDLAKGDAKIITLAKKPFVDRALESLFSILKQSDQAAAG